MDIAGKVDNALHLVLEYSLIMKYVEESPTPKAPLSVSPLQNRIKDPDRYPWLVDIKDAEGNRPGDENYDPRTLYVPSSHWSKFTPFERQFWEVKSKNWDSVVFFKKGKFYELYESDADIGHQLFDLKMTDRVNMRMVGVPEASFDGWAARFVAKGYKIVRVDQLENMIGKQMREKGSTKDKVIRREVTCILTAGTLVDRGLLVGDESVYCMSIKFGVCFLDAATSEFNICQISDDKSRSKLATLLHQIKPRELITEKGHLSAETTRLIKNTLTNLLWNQFKPGREFWDAITTEDEIRLGDYFKDEQPSTFTELRDKPLAISAFGAMMSHLRTLKLDNELITAKNIHIYDPIRGATSLILDGQTLMNLEIFENDRGSFEGTLHSILSRCRSPFGKRLFRQWLCHPLREPRRINERLDAVEDLLENHYIHEELNGHLGALPDLERLISSIHSKRIKVDDFLMALKGFEKTQEMMDALAEKRDHFKSPLFKKIINGFPKIQEYIDSLKTTFHVNADVVVDYQKITALIPKDNTNEEWDSLMGKMQTAEDDFNKHLRNRRRELNCHKLEYKHMNKDIYLIEAPKKFDPPRQWVKISGTSAVVRYLDHQLKDKIQEYKELRETKSAFIKDFSKVVYEQFDENYTVWLKAVRCIAEIDALASLAKASADLGESCRPEILEQEESLVQFEQLRHPCVIPGPGQSFIPNDITVGGDDSSILVLTGPNMGGKSTLLRQACVAIIMAQLGCYVPATSCRLTPCDQIFTRIGANDNIMAGQSTFMVELQETSKILRESTPRSMVILDELGRGTSTFDGYAIAYAVLHHLATHVGCLSLFSTHYHTLCQEFEQHPSIKNMHM
ncbi:hypothetical protein K492DRAFT_217243 [Lichtheimia hyalospora FSU 10163]|nr:hypothetical protein K492DRAFT_217243 [Lichtheimia hyalospora FSU 10163]